VKPPAFQFYASDFLAGCSLFNMEQRGLYITLLCLQWDHGFITLEDYQTCSTAMAQPLAKAVLRKFDPCDNGEKSAYQNARLEAERVKQAEFRANRSESGKVGAKKRWHSHSTAIATQCPANAQPMANDSSPSPSPSPSPKRTESDPNRPSLEEILEYAKSAHCGLGRWKAEDWFNEMEAAGWLDYNHRPIQDWKAAMRRVKSKWEADGRPAGPPKAKANSHHPQPTTFAQAQARQLAEMEARATKAINYDPSRPL
jgi:uncharacterized protein YdaU (DUF1376 family)